MWQNKVFLVLLICCYNARFGNSQTSPSPNLLTDVELKELCQGIEFQYIAHPSNQQSYIICIPGGGIEKQCDPSNCFDERKPPCSTTCSANTNVPDQKTKDYCNDDDTPLLDRVANDKDCDSYFICVGKNVDPLAQKCPTNQHFSEKHKTCMSYHEANCAANSKWCKNRRDNTRFPKDTCYEYYECQAEITLTKTCSYGEHFDKDLGQCVSGICQDDKRVPDCKNEKDGFRLRHSKCYKYFVCLNQALFEAQCANGYYFESDRGVCMKDTYKVCNDD
ncbi:peritrophin-44-like [Lucilia cuprina]|uniref:peritrophin-44-like n=1 Tax=Lucilia cuprina TaxID=7375 RepID=UPI001F05375A|nr:peritrophin-44-like [Lucilia cuprina]